MDRRTLLALTALLPGCAASPALSCSPQLASPQFFGLQTRQVKALFYAWWSRDSEQFRSLFSDLLMDDGTLMDPEIARELLAGDPLPPETYTIFDQFFTDQSKIQKITLIVNTHAGVFVACSESNLSQIIESDCSGMPALHLFLVTMSGLNPRAMQHLASTETPEVSKFGIWTEGAS